ncbi:MAG TPA: FliM/FliN family flagellar motor switch protein [Kofleriaceae bacterium]|nr:FliM/FliN family flagellar motor switch protein [Kofleriaceae bacterium]
MSDLPLDLAELEAIQAAIRQASPSVTASADPADVSPLPLIAAERNAQAARPRLADLTARWARRLPRILRAHVGDVTVDSMGAEILDARSLGDELRPMWIGVVHGEGTGAVAMVIAIGGELVEIAAAKRCGGNVVGAAGASGRDPSPLALRLFGPIGDSTLTVLDAAWLETNATGLKVVPTTAASVGHALGADAVLGATLNVGGRVPGRIRVFVRPELLLPAVERSAAVAAADRAVAAALGGVPVEVRVELATMSIPMSELRRLGPGSQLTLPVFVDDPLPIYCGDVLKAWGRPVVTRGVLAVEVAALAVPGGGRP